jgi:hypothetical protein
VRELAAKPRDDLVGRELAVSFGFRSTNIRPLFVRPPQETRSRSRPSGSRCTVSTKRWSFCSIAWKDVSWSAWIVP